MKIYDCFIYFDEELLLDVRFNILDKFVDRFVIVESKYSHRGESRNPTFNINNFPKFKNKIEYILLDKNPNNLFKIEKNDKEFNEKIILNGNIREFFQRNTILEGLTSASDEDLIIISDVDEIPSLDQLHNEKINNSPFFFNQIFCCYKFNLYSKMRWCGSRMIKKKKLKSPQWLRDIKDKNYPKWRLDTYFSNKKYNDIKFIEDGGWHFSYLKEPKDVEKKLKSIRHHIEYDQNPIGIQGIADLIRNKKLIYNYKADQRTLNKFKDNETLEILEKNKLPKYIQDNFHSFNKWLVD